MKRRDFFKKAGVAAASASLSPLMFANAQNGRIRGSMVTSWPTSLDTLYGGATSVARYLSELTGGDVEIEVFPAGAQVGGLEVYDAVASGAFEFGHTASYYYTSKNPTHAFFTAVPFGLTVTQHDAWLLAGGGLELWNELNARDGLIAFPAGNTGQQMGGWFNKEINTPADLQGLTMRTPGLGGAVMSRAGVNVQVLPGGEIYVALERGVLDAAEWVGPYDDEILGFNNVARYYYAPGWQEPSAGFGTYVNLDFYESQPEDIQAAIRMASARANEQVIADYDAKNGAALQRLIENGAELRFFPTEVLRTLEGHMDAIHEETAASNEFYARVYEDWRAFRDEIRDYHRVTEKSFLDYVLPSESPAEG